MESAYFSGGIVEHAKIYSEFFFNLPFVLEDFILSMGTSVASAYTAETIFEIMKCIADVDMLQSGRIWGQNAKFSGFSILATPTIEIFRFLDVGHFFVQETR